MFASFVRAGVVAAAASTAVVVSGTQVCAASASVTGVSPTYGPIGAAVDITGAGFTGARQVTFNGTAARFSVDATGTDIHASVPTGATSGPVAVTASDGSVASGPSFSVQPTAATLARSVGSLTFPATVTLTATVTSGGQRAARQPAQLQRQVDGSSSWVSTGAPATTSSSGVASWVFSPRSTAYYRVVAGASSSYQPVVSSPVQVFVRPLVTLSLVTVAPTRTRIPVTGSVRPAASGAVVLDRLVGGAWHAMQTATLTGSSGYSFMVRLPATGRYAYRVRRPADATHLSGLSATERVTGVHRTLRSGMAGSDVLALQRRLAELHYDIGTIDGHYGSDTVHAVTAFEKVQGMRRDAVVGMSVWSRLVTPRVPRARHPLRGAAVEVDLTHQVVYYLVNGGIRRIMDSSTGGGYYYTGSDGSTQRAITPTGHFHVVYKVNHWVTSRLGTLYRPAYFNNDGYALHGEDLVPPYPASHGCVRITVPAMNRLYNKLHVGMSVWIYR